MALDGVYLYALKQELASIAVGNRVEKVHQPSRDEIVLHLRGRNGARKLFISVRPDSPRAHFTDRAPENPDKPPMLCMLLRKYLTGAVVSSIGQYGLDRVLTIGFDATNEIGDRIRLTLYIEIMAKHSNAILVDGEGCVIDSVKRIDATKSSYRIILPGVPYVLPPQQDKLNLLECDVQEILERVRMMEASTLSGALLKCVQGVSPVVCREVVYRAVGEDIRVAELSTDGYRAAGKLLEWLKALINAGDFTPGVVFDESGKPREFSFLPVMQYGSAVHIKRYETLSDVLDDFYYERDVVERTRRREHDLFKLLTTLCERAARKLNSRRAELESCKDKDEPRIKAELINANLYRLEKGSLFYEVENYYEENRPVRISADPALTPSQNAQKYYKEYRKAFNAEKVLGTLIEESEQEVAYLDSVSDELSRAQTRQEIDEIREELARSGYIKRSSVKQRKMAALPPMEFVSSDGYKILVGRNNLQNDKLSLKTASKSDLWFHTKDIPGSHVILCCHGSVPPERSILEAAQIAAFYSKASGSTRVEVDYTYAKELKKPAGAKPGKVIYHTNKTLLVDPALPPDGNM